MMIMSKMRNRKEVTWMNMMIFQKQMKKTILSILKISSKIKKTYKMKISFYLNNFQLNFMFIVKKSFKSKPNNNKQIIVMEFLNLILRIALDKYLQLSKMNQK